MANGRRFDQQPIEATALLLAAEAAFDESGDDRYLAAMERCYGWFLGHNDIGVPVADPAAAPASTASKQTGSIPTRAPSRR